MGQIGALDRREVGDLAKRESPYILVASYVILLVFIGGSLLHFERGIYDNSTVIQNVVGADDAYIAYRYGWNLAQHHILSWNESGFRRTEGFTNPLWMLLSAGWSLLGDKALVYPGMVLTSVTMMALFLAVESQLISRKTKSAKSLIGIFLLCISPVVWLHATSGLEAGVFGAGIGLLAYYTIFGTESDRAGFGLANLLAFFLVQLRSDGFVYLLILLTGLVLAGNKNWRMFVYGGGSSILLLAVWRELSFGQLMPNTAVAKLSFSAMARIPCGIVSFSQSLASGGLVILLAGLFGIPFLPRLNRLSATITLAGWIAYYVYIGGDLYLERHLIGVFVLSAGLSQYFFQRILQDKKGWMLALALLIGVLAPFYAGDPRFAYLQERHQDAWILLGEEIASQRSAYGTIVISPAGKIPFYAGGNFVDEFGINDPDLSKIKRAKFIPGHAAGSREAAIMIARQSSTLYSYFGFGLDLTENNASNVLVWVNNGLPDGVHYKLTVEQHDMISRAQPLLYSLIFQGK